MSSPIHSRLGKLRQKLVAGAIDAFLVSTPENRRYLSGFTGSAGYLLITAADAVLATDFRYVEQANHQAPDYRVIRIGNDNQWLPNLMADMSVGRIGVESQNLTIAQYKEFTDVLKKKGPSSDPPLLATAGLVEALRAVKDAEELSFIQRAIDIADTAFERITSALRPGTTEQEIAWELEKSIKEQGADSISFDLIVAAGANGAMPHHRPSDRPVLTGEPVVIDMGAQYNGYCSDMTRTIVLGTPDEMFQRVYDTVLAAQETAIATVQAKMTSGDADALARNIITDANYGDAFGHGLGHGVGLAVHEYPGLGPGSKAVLEDGMVFTVEPGIYLPGWGGVRIEDMVVLEKGKAHVLTHAPKKEALGRVA